MSCSSPARAATSVTSSASSTPPFRSAARSPRRMSCESRRSVGARTVSGRSCIATPTQSPIATLLVANSPNSSRMASTGSRRSKFSRQGAAFGRTPIWTLIDPVSCVSCVSWLHWVYAAETRETFHQESDMRYQVSSLGPVCAEIGPLRCPPTPVEPLSRFKDRGEAVPASSLRPDQSSNRTSSWPAHHRCCREHRYCCSTESARN